MSQSPYSQPPGPPPLPAGAVEPPPRTVWPVVIGVISIVMGSLGLVCTPISLAINAVNPHARQVREFFPPWWRSWEIASTFLAVALGTLLLIGGILLLKRRGPGRALHLAYAFAALALCLLNGLLMSGSFSRIINAPGPAAVGMIVGVIGGACGGSIYPFFLLVWFLRGKIAAEVETWHRA